MYIYVSTNEQLSSETSNLINNSINDGYLPNSETAPLFFQTWYSFHLIALYILVFALSIKNYYCVAGMAKLSFLLKRL